MEVIGQHRAPQIVAEGLSMICGVALGLASLISVAFAADKPPLAPDAVEPLTTSSRISATIEFGLPALASAIERDIPRRLVTIDERINCVNRRVLVLRVHANCDVSGFVDRSGAVSLYGRGDRVYGSVPIYGAVEGQGANRFTARIQGETEASATVEAEARPQLRRDWSLDLNFSDSFHWNKPPVLHVLGRDIPLAKYAEPRIRTQLSKIRSRALAAARRLDLQAKAATAWQRAFEPIKLADEPEVWLQLTPQSAAFSGMRATAKVLSGSIELSGSAETVLGHGSPAVTPTPFPALGTDVSEPGTFDVILPIRISYNTLRDKIMEVLDAAPKGENAVREVQVYPSAGKLIIGLRVTKSSDTTAAGEWLYLGGALNVDPDKQTVRLSDLSVQGVPIAIDAISGGSNLLAQLKEKAEVSYGVAYQNLLNAANERLTRPLKGGFRMEGHLTSAKLSRVALLADDVSIELRASGTLKLLYGL